VDLATINDHRRRSPISEGSAGERQDCRPATTSGDHGAGPASSAAAAAPTAAAATRGRGDAAAHRDRAQQLDGVVVPIRAASWVGCGVHRATDLERRAAFPAAEVVAGHPLSLRCPAPATQTFIARGDVVHTRSSARAAAGFPSWTRARDTRTPTPRLARCAPTHSIRPRQAQPTPRLAPATPQLAPATSRLVQPAPQLAQYASRLAQPASQLARAAPQLAPATPQLARATSTRAGCVPTRACCVATRAAHSPTRAGAPDAPGRGAGRRRERIVNVAFRRDDLYSP
jgi:hypothetical protein